MIRLVVALLASMFATDACRAAAPAPATLMRDIQTNGARAVIAMLHQSGEWAAVVEQISGGSRDWIDVAVHLTSGSDAGSSEELGIALAEALPRNPADVLRAASPDDATTGINTVCGVPFIETSHAFNKANQRRALAALRRVQTPDLVQTRDRCEARLKS